MERINVLSRPGLQTPETWVVYRQWNKNNEKIAKNENRVPIGTLIFLIKYIYNHF